MRDEAEAAVSEWMERVEASVERVHAALLSPERGAIPQFAMEMESACREGFSLMATPAMAPRLGALRERLMQVRSMLRQACAFMEAREQLETGCVLGYTPRGLERAL
jgi:hypothetical protein